MTTVTQTRTKMPYSNWPIQRAKMTCETRAMAALTMRTRKRDQRNTLRNGVLR